MAFFCKKKKKGFKMKLEIPEVMSLLRNLPGMVSY